MQRTLRAIVIAGFVALGVASAGAPAALADKCSNPAICQYEEQIPTATGSKIAGSGGSTKVASLPTSVERSIARQTTGSATETQTLLNIATASGAAAPKKIKLAKAKQKHVQKAIKSAEVQSTKPVRAGFDAVGGGGDGHLTGLIVVMAVMTAAAAAAGIARRRSARARRR